MIICDDTKCDPRDRNTSTFEETRKCFEKGQLKSSKNYKTKCIERKDNDRGYSISDCHPQTDQKYFKFIPHKGLIKSHDNKCADMSQKDPYGRNQMLTFQNCDENKKEQKFKYDKNKFIHYNDKYIQTNIGWAEESRSINDPVNKWFDHLLKLS